MTYVVGPLMGLWLERAPQSDTQPCLRAGLPTERSEKEEFLADRNKCFLYSTLHCKNPEEGRGRVQTKISVRIRGKQHSHTVGGSVKYKTEWFDHFGKNLAVSYNKIHTKLYDTEIPLLVVYPRK